MFHVKLIERHSTSTVKTIRFFHNSLKECQLTVLSGYGYRLWALAVPGGCGVLVLCRLRAHVVHCSRGPYYKLRNKRSRYVMIAQLV